MIEEIIQFDKNLFLPVPSIIQAFLKTRSNINFKSLSFIIFNIKIIAKLNILYKLEYKLNKT